MIAQGALTYMQFFGKSLGWVTAVFKDAGDNTFFAIRQSGKSGWFFLFDLAVVPARQLDHDSSCGCAVKPDLACMYLVYRFNEIRGCGITFQHTTGSVKHSFICQ